MTSLRSGPSANTTGIVVAVAVAAGVAPASALPALAFAWRATGAPDGCHVTVASLEPVAGRDGTCGPGTMKLYLITFSGGATQSGPSGVRSVNDDGAMLWVIGAPAGGVRVS